MSDVGEEDAGFVGVVVDEKMKQVGGHINQKSMIFENGKALKPFAREFTERQFYERTIEQKMKE